MVSCLLVVLAAVTGAALAGQPSMKLPGGFRLGDELRVKGVYDGDTEWSFSVNILDKAGNLAIHVNPRFNAPSEQRFIVAAKLASGWTRQGKVVKPEGDYCGIEKGKEFEMAIKLAEPALFKVSVNGKACADFGLLPDFDLSEASLLVGGGEDLKVKQEVFTANREVDSLEKAAVPPNTASSSDGSTTPEPVEEIDCTNDDCPEGMFCHSFSVDDPDNPTSSYMQYKCRPIECTDGCRSAFCGAVKKRDTQETYGDTCCAADKCNCNDPGDCAKPGDEGYCGGEDGWKVCQDMVGQSATEVYHCSMRTYRCEI